MSRDPFEELFGPLSDDAGNGDTGAESARGSETPTAPLPTPRADAPVPGVRRRQGGQEPNLVPAVTAATAPVPARKRLAHEQAERVHTAQQPASSRGNVTSSRLPWIIVGAVAVIAIVVSIVVVNIARGTESAPEANTNTTTEPTTPQPEPESDTPSPTTPETPKPEERPKDEAPSVEVGPTDVMLIGPWNATSQLSQRFGPARFEIPDNVNLQLSSGLLDSFPESCAAMRTAWGATRLDDGTFQVRKPAESCAEAPELYDTVWGLVTAWVETIKPV